MALYLFRIGLAAFVAVMATWVLTRGFLGTLTDALARLP